jgi:peptide/nickel transport system permease protein
MLQQVFDNNAVNTGYWWWWLPPGICIALVGTSLALLNFGIDEFINPRLRAVGLTRKAARKAGIGFRATLGFTPVVRGQKAPVSPVSGSNDGREGSAR